MRLRTKYYFYKIRETKFVSVPPPKKKTPLTFEAQINAPNTDKFDDNFTSARL